MSIRFTEEEALALGFRKDAKGNWYKPGDRTPVRARSVRPVPELEQLPPRKDESSVRPNKANEKSRKKSVRESSDRRHDITIRAFRHRDIDPDNLCAKWFVDEFVKQGILPGDSSKYIRRVIKEVEVIPKTEKERVVIVVDVLRKKDAG